VEGPDRPADEDAACGVSLLRAFAYGASYGFFCKKGIDLDQSQRTLVARQEKDRPGVAALATFRRKIHSRPKRQRRDSTRFRPAVVYRRDVRDG
jgi:hypothetical protein